MGTIAPLAHELLALFTLHTLGVAVLGKFESETPWWRLTLKWTVILLLIYWITSSFGHWIALTAIVVLLIIGVVFHFWWCKRNSIHPLKATSRKKDYELRGWEWKEYPNQKNEFKRKFNIG